MKRDERVSSCAESRRILKSHLSQLQLGFFPFAVIPPLAGYLASPAADAFGRVHEGSLCRRRRGRLRHDRLPVALCAFARGSCALTTLTKQAFVS